MKKAVMAGWLILSLIFVGCEAEGSEATAASPPSRGSPTPLPEGILVREIPPEADVIFTSIRYVLDDPACLDDGFQLKDHFIQDPDCNRLVYGPDGGLALPRQLFTLDLETGKAVQITNTACFFVSGQVIDSTALMVNAICADTDGDGKTNEQDDPQLYVLDLAAGKMDCLTCEWELKAVNNPDYSPVNERIVFSAQKGGVFHNYLFTIDVNRDLEQITSSPDYMDFDCAWSEDGTLVVFNRLPSPWFEQPAQIWMMDADGSSLEKITDGGDNPEGEGPHRRYPIGTDADADLSPDNEQIVFSRLVTGMGNEPFGVWALMAVDLKTGEETVLDDRYANMVPEWKAPGILFMRQVGGSDPMRIQQALYRYQAGSFIALETFPYDIFPLGGFGGSWITRN